MVYGACAVFGAMGKVSVEYSRRMRQLRLSGVEGAGDAAQMSTECGQRKRGLAGR